MTKMSYLSEIAFLILTITSIIPKSESIASMAIDFGSEFMKVAVVKPGVPMEIALDSDSARKTATIVVLRDDERLFGNAAQSMGIKFPAKAYVYIPNLLGKSSKHPDVQKFLTKFPYYKIRDHPENGQLMFVHDDKTEYSVEEIASMLLEKAKETAEKFTGMPMKATVITVPAHYTQSARRALLRAANFINLNVLQLMSEHTAVALNYGIFRYRSFNATAQYYMFVDSGSSHTTAAIVEYRTVKHSEAGGFAEDTPQLSIIGLGYDSTLGGTEFVLRLRNHLAKEFNAMKKASKDVNKVPRSMAKLFKEAQRVMRVLSANNEITAQVENVMEDIDLKVAVTRKQFEEMCDDLFNRVKQPIDMALNQAQIPLNSISEVILMGGTTRIPKIQSILLKTTEKKELGKSVNSDEAIALGAVYQAAHLSPGFRVKRFLVRDTNIFPITVKFQRADSDKMVTRTLFGLLNRVPQKKVLTFNKQLNDFNFYVALGELNHIPDAEAKNLITHLSTYKLNGVKEAYEKHMNAADKEKSETPLIDHKGIKAHFELDANGMFQLSSVESVFVKSPALVEKENKEAESQQGTLSKIGSKLSNMFGSGKEENATETDSKTAGDKSEKKADSESGKEAKGKDANDTNVNATTVKKEPPKPKTVTELLKWTVDHLDQSQPTKAQELESIKKLQALRDADEEKRLLEKSKNELEGYIFDARDRLTSDDYYKCSTDKEREVVTKQLSAASEWYEEQGMDTKRAEYETKLGGLKLAMKDLEFRVLELRARPAAFKRLKDIVNTTEMFYKTAKNFSSGESGAALQSIFTEAEIKTLSVAIGNANAWLKDKEEAHKAMVLSKYPTFLSSEVDTKIEELQREMQYLINKINIWKANPPPPPKTETNTTASADNSTTPSNTTSSAGDGGDKKEADASDTTSSKAEDTKKKKEDIKVEKTDKKSSEKKIKTDEL